MKIRFLIIILAVFVFACSTSKSVVVPVPTSSIPQAQSKPTIPSSSVTDKNSNKPVIDSKKKLTNKPQAELLPTTSLDLSGVGYTVTPEINLEEWKQIGDDDGVRTYQKKVELDGLVAFRGETIIPTSIVRIAAVFDDPSIRKDWIDALAAASVVSQANRLNRVEYNHTTVPWPFQDRDFVYDVHIEIAKSPKVMILKMKNGDDASMPHVDGVVRGKLTYCYYYIQELPSGNATKVVVEIVVDPMGNIPKWLVNLTSKKWPQHTLAGLSKVSQRDNLVIPNDLDNFYKTGGKQ